MFIRMTHFPGNGEIFGLNPYAQLFTTKEGRKHIELTLTEYALCTGHSAGCLDTLSPRWLSLRGWGSNSHFRIVSSLPGLRQQHPYWHLLLILLPDSPFWIQMQQSVTQLYRVPFLPGALQASPMGIGIKSTLPSVAYNTSAHGLAPPTERSLVASGTTVFPTHSLCFSPGVSPQAKASQQPVLVLS